MAFLGFLAEGYEDALIEIMSFSAKQCYAGVKIVRSESRVTCVKQISAAAPDKECSCNLATLFSYLSRLLCRVKIIIFSSVFHIFPDNSILYCCNLELLL